MHDPVRFQEIFHHNNPRAQACQQLHIFTSSTKKIALEKLQGSAQHTRNPFSACDRGMPTGVKKSCAWAGVQALA